MYGIRQCNQIFLCGEIGAFFTEIFFSNFICDIFNSTLNSQIFAFDILSIINRIRHLSRATLKSYHPILAVRIIERSINKLSPAQKSQWQNACKIAVNKFNINDPGLCVSVSKWSAQLRLRVTYIWCTVHKCACLHGHELRTRYWL